MISRVCKILHIFTQFLYLKGKFMSMSYIFNVCSNFTFESNNELVEINITLAICVVHIPWKRQKNRVSFDSMLAGSRPLWGPTRSSAVGSVDSQCVSQLLRLDSGRRAQVGVYKYARCGGATSDQACSSVTVCAAADTNPCRYCAIAPCLCL